MGRGKTCLFPALVGKIREVGLRQDELAADIGVDPSTLSAKLHGQTEFKRDEMARILEALGEPLTKIPKYFFNL